jgi:hypothetical protein
MLYPPELQIRIADMPKHLDDAEWQRELDRDCLAFLRNEIRVYGRLRPHAYPNIFSTTHDEVLQRPTSFSSRNPSWRLLVTQLVKLGESISSYCSFIKSFFGLTIGR